MKESTRADLQRLWDEHLAAGRPVPQDDDSYAELVLSDTTIAGVASGMLSRGQVLHPSHRPVLRRCLDSLDDCYPRLDSDGQACATRLRRLADVLLQSHS